MMQGSKPRRSGGFALVEALASLVVLGMIGLMIVQGVGVGQRVWERLDVHEAGGEVVDAAQTILRDRLEQTYPATDYQGGAPTIDFEGGAQKAVFLASPPLSERPSGLRRYTLSLNDKSQLVLTSISAVGRERAAPLTQVLLDNVRSVDLSYFRSLGATSSPVWYREWSGEAALPQVIRVQVGFDPNDPRHWPDLLIRPWATIDAGCRLDPVYHGCRGRQ
jgi:general secretion pathway protein J